MSLRPASLNGSLLNAASYEPSRKSSLNSEIVTIARYLAKSRLGSGTDMIGKVPEASSAFHNTQANNKY
ncbi:hypothetical protein AB6A40_000657 [Gnathostoma spinigerum]|uniref:Uncharacterized protein n=1 Tax=Gnathostoma spinigerum TaxID=75299 RepID=A0ABD6EB14_9BILA